MVTPHVHALSCKSRAFLTRWRRVPITLGLPTWFPVTSPGLGGTSVLGVRLSDVVARASVVGTVAAGSGVAGSGAAGSDVGVVFAIAV